MHFDVNTLNTTSTHEPDELCGICTLAMGPFNAMQSLKLCCCSNDAWYHKSCLKEIAFGLNDDFECVSCDNRDNFRKNMRANGIFIPENGYITEKVQSDESPPKQKRRRIHKVWTLEETFKSKSEAIAAVESEKMWSYYYENKSDAGLRINYRCNLMKFRGQQCASGLYLLYDSRNANVHLYRAESPHTHDDDDNKENAVDRISGELEARIRSLFQLNVKPKAILYTLVKEKFKPPTKTKLTTFLNKIRKEKFGSEKLHFGTLEKWLEETSPVPSSDNQPFVVAYKVCTDEDNFENSIFRFFVSTKLLLNQAVNAKILHTDATYKLVWQGFPVLQIGTTDADRKFHPFGIAVCTNERADDFEFIFRSLREGVLQITAKEIDPNVLVSDAAASIHNGFKKAFTNLSNDDIAMCWSHVRRVVLKNLPKYIKDPKKQIEFMRKFNCFTHSYFALSIVNRECKLIILYLQFFCSDDLDKLQLAQNRNIFDAAAELFLLKWKKHSIELVKYFKKEWLTANKNWYEGFKSKTPSTNNALESSNKVIKDEQTLRERFDLSQFRGVLFSMVEQWSVEYSTGLNKINFGAPIVKLEIWTKGYNFARSNVKITSSRNAGKIIYSIPMSIDAIDGAENYAKWSTFDEYKSEAFAVVHTSFNYPVTSDNWLFGECDCSDGFKLFVCQHMVGIALRLKVTVAPSEAKTIPIGQKRKPGRPSKSKPALQFQ